MTNFQELRKHRPFLVPTMTLSVLLILFIVIMQLSFPKKAVNGYSSFIVAFEFAQSMPEIHSLFDEMNQAELKNVDLGNYFDFGFMFTYSTLIAFLFIQSAQVFNRKWLYIGVLLALLILTSDFTENVILLKITKLYVSDVNDQLIIPLLKKLHFITWIKWGGLAFTFFIFYEVLIRLKWIYKISGILLTLPFLFILVTKEFTPSKISLFTNTVFLSYFMLIVFGIAYKKRLPE